MVYKNGYYSKNGSVLKDMCTFTQYRNTCEYIINPGEKIILFLGHWEQVVYRNEMFIVTNKNKQYYCVILRNMSHLQIIVKKNSALTKLLRSPLVAFRTCSLL